MYTCFMLKMCIHTHGNYGQENLHSTFDTGIFCFLI